MRFAVILSGCGQHDGSETHETILTLLALAQERIEWDGFAPNRNQAKVINHLNQQASLREVRNVLVESARLVRGHVKDLKKIVIEHYDAILFPGGMGAVLNLCDWAEKDFAFDFHPDVDHVLQQCKQQHKPLGFICIAPVMIPKLYPGCQLTIGNDKPLSAQINAAGGVHVDCPADEVVVDKQYKVVSTPANMTAKSIVEVQRGIHRLVHEVKKLV